MGNNERTKGEPETEAPDGLKTVQAEMGNANWNIQFTKQFKTITKLDEEVHYLALTNQVDGMTVGIRMTDIERKWLIHILTMLA